MATLKDIAALAGVNTSTVSKALRGSNDIKAETCTRIRALADELGYVYWHPKQPTVSTVGVVFPELCSQYYYDIQKAFRRRMLEKGLRTLVALTEFDPCRELDAIEAFISDEVGAICCLSENTNHLAQIRVLVERADIPFLFICPKENIDFCDSISINHNVGASLAVGHLIEQGHRKIAYIGEPNTRPREASFLATMREHGLDVPPEYIVNQPERYEQAGYLGMKRLLAMNNLPTAVFAAYDNIAYGAMRAIHEAGLSIPADISLIGIDANTTSKYVWPALASVDSATQDIGELASVLLTKRIEGRHTVSYQNIRFCPTLRLGESTAPPRK